MQLPTKKDIEGERNRLGDKAVCSLPRLRGVMYTSPLSWRTLLFAMMVLSLANSECAPSQSSRSNYGKLLCRQRHDLRVWPPRRFDS